jgi:hypothetical protein
MWFWHAPTSDRQNQFAGRFTGQRFLFLEPISSARLPGAYPDKPKDRFVREVRSERGERWLDDRSLCARSFIG